MQFNLHSFCFLRKPQYRSARPDDIRMQCTQRSQFVGRIVFDVFNVFGVSSVFNASNFFDASHVFHCVQLQTGDARVPKTCVLCIPLCSLYSTVFHCIPLCSLRAHGRVPKTLLRKYPKLLVTCHFVWVKMGHSAGSRYPRPNKLPPLNDARC